MAICAATSSVAQPFALTVARRARVAGVPREASPNAAPPTRSAGTRPIEQRRHERQAEAERHHARVDHDAAEAWKRECGTSGSVTRIAICASTTPSAAPSSDSTTASVSS
jgi:hypothetical protein